jgi:hypothetical protein
MLTFFMHCIGWMFLISAGLLVIGSVLDACTSRPYGDSRGEIVLAVLDKGIDGIVLGGMFAFAGAICIVW